MILGGHFDFDSKQKLFISLNQKMNDVNFWNDKEEANLILTRIRDLRNVRDPVLELDKSISNNLEVLKDLDIEKDNELYNAGITDVSHRYEKMYVIRPQSFIPIITLLRTASMNSLQYKKQMIEMKNTNIDISNFEDNMNKFKDAFNRNYMLASRKFNEAIEEIDKSIDHLQKIKDALVSSDRNLRLANDKANDLTIKKLVSKNKTMARKFADETGD